MLKNTLVVLVGLLGALAPNRASAATTLQFGQTGVGRLTGFADHLGTATDGMRWGMIIDTSNTNTSGASNGNGFAGITFDATGLATGGSGYDIFDNTVSGFLKVNGVTTDDFYFTAGLLTSTQTATGSDPGGVGGITALANAPNGTDGLIPGVTTNDPFAITWFETSPLADGTYYGMFDPSYFTLPASGVSVSYASNYGGATADPAKAALLQITPEPSRVMLILLGMVAAAVRRSRNGSVL